MNWISFVVIIVVLVCFCYVVKKGFTNSLYMLHRKAYFKYKSEVVSGSKSYERFVRDFCNENIFFVAKSAEQLNEQNRNYNIIQELLSQRQDLVSKYFSSSSFSVEDFRKMNKEFNTTHIIPEPIIVQEPKTDIKEKIIVKKNVVGIENPFGCRLKKEQFTLLADCINEVRAFQNDISPEELENFFFCRLEGAFKSKNNRTIAYILNALYLNNYINESWQAVIEKHQLVLSPMKEGYVKANDLSSANNNYPKGAEIIDDYIKQLKKH